MVQHSVKVPTVPQDDMIWYNKDLHLKLIDKLIRLATNVELEQIWASALLNWTQKQRIITTNQTAAPQLR